MPVLPMLRQFHKSDLPQVLAIEKAVHICPWTAETFEICFRSGYLGWVIEIAQRIVGFIIISLHANECHILNLCIAQQYQHQGLGKKLLDYVLDYAQQQNMAFAYLEVRHSNTRAINLYKKMKFQLVGTRKNYYPTVAGNEDALIFAKSLLKEPLA